VTSPESSGSSVTRVAVAATRRSGRSESCTIAVPATRTSSSTAAKHDMLGVLDVVERALDRRQGQAR